VRSLVGALILLGSLVLPLRAGAPWMDSSMGLLQGELTARFGPGQRLRVQRGLAQAARFWRPGDGGAGEFEPFVRDHFAGTPAALDALFARLEAAMDSLDAHLGAIGREFRRAPEGPGAILAGFDPGAHLSDDFFGDKLAFVVLLNFPLTTPEERLREGGAWTGRQWAEAWLAERFARRVPAEVNAAAAEAAAAARRYRPGSGDGCRVLLGTFQAARRLDPYAPLAPTRMARSFNGERQLPEARVRAMLEAVCASPLAGRAARALGARLGRVPGPDDLGRPEPGSPAPEAGATPGPAFAAALAALERPLPALDAYWRAYAGAGPALVEMDVWHWLYAHPDSTAEALRAALDGAARAVWNRYYAPVLGARDSTLLAEGAGLVAGNLDLADLPLSLLIAAQIQRHPGGDPGAAAARCARLGRVTPDLWMTRATGAPLGPGALLEAAAEAAGRSFGNSKGGPLPADCRDDKILLRRPGT